MFGFKKPQLSESQKFFKTKYNPDYHREVYKKQFKGLEIW